jgi:hypothetical protein
MGGRGAAGDAACGWEEDGDSTQRAVPDDAALLGGSSTRKRRRRGRGGADAAEAGASAERRAGLPCHQERRGQPGAAIGHRGRRLGAPSVRFDTSVSQKPGAL